MGSFFLILTQHVVQPLWCSGILATIEIYRTSYGSLLPFPIYTESGFSLLLEPGFAS